MVRRITSIFLVAAFAVACSKNAITGRKQFKLVSEATLQAMATEQYQQFLSSNRVLSSSNNRDAEMVKRVGQRVTRAITNYYQSQGLASELEGYKWEYNLVDDKA